MHPKTGPKTTEGNPKGTQEPQGTVGTIHPAGYSEPIEFVDGDSTEELRELLLLVGIDADVRTIGSWNAARRLAVWRWAGAVHLASTERVWVPPRPFFLPEPWEPGQVVDGVRGAAVPGPPGPEEDPLEEVNAARRLLEAGITTKERFLAAARFEVSQRECRICGCTDAAACDDAGAPCHWVEEDVCSACLLVGDEQLVDQLVLALAPVMFRLGHFGKGLARCVYDQAVEIVAERRRRRRGGCP